MSEKQNLPRDYNDLVELVESNDTSVVAQVLSEQYVPIEELKELADEWEVQEEDPGKTQAAQAQLSICATELRNLIEDHE